MKIRIFGEPWDSPMCDDAIAEGRVEEVPVGQPCQWCEEPIQAGQSGILMARIESATNWSIAPTHKECYLRETLGSLGHLQHTCHCYGGTQGDPPGLSPREAALALWDFVRSFES